MPLPSGQEPPVYSANHGSFFKNKQFKPVSALNWKVSTVEWSAQTFIEKGPSGIDVTNKYGLIPRFMKSLKYYELPLYKPYTDEEMALYRPQNI